MKFRSETEKNVRREGNQNNARRSAMEPLGEIPVDTGRGYRSELESAFPPPPFPIDEDHEVARIRKECDHVQYLFCIYLLVTSSLELYCGQTIRPTTETRDPEEALYWRLRGRPGDNAKRSFSALEPSRLAPSNVTRGRPAEHPQQKGARVSLGFRRPYGDRLGLGNRAKVGG